MTKQIRKILTYLDRGEYLGRGGTDGAAQALLDHLLSLPELQQNKPWPDDGIATRDAIRGYNKALIDIWNVLHRELGTEANEA